MGKQQTVLSSFFQKASSSASAGAAVPTSSRKRPRAPNHGHQAGAAGAEAGDGRGGDDDARPRKRGGGTAVQRQERDLSHFGHGGAGVAPDAVRELRMGTALASMHVRRAEREGGGVADLLGVVGPRGKGKGGKGGSSYTPLEQQVLALQRKHAGLGALLAFEVGYKYMFYGEDARTAAEVLSIVAYPKQHFIQAGVPTARLKYHLRRLVEAGHKVGVVRQTETRALKAASAGRSKTFTRALSVSERASAPPPPRPSVGLRHASAALQSAVTLAADAAPGPVHSAQCTGHRAVLGGEVGRR
jgi:hypothetical protein